MASHRRKDKWRDPVVAPVLHDALDDGRDVGNAPAPDTNRHPGAGLKTRSEAALLELTARLCTDIGQAEVRETLADKEQS